MALQDRKPPPEKKSQTTEEKSSSSRRPPRRGSDLDKIRQGLNELVGTIGAGQQMMGVALQEPAHFVGGKVTEEMGPRLVDAWVNLAESSPMVKSYLLRLTQGTAYGEVVFVTIGFAMSQAQAYGALPISFPNPFMDVSEFVPPSPEVAAHEASNGRTVPVTPTPGERPSSEEGEMSEAEIAQQEAERIAEHRRSRKGPIVESG